MGTLIFIGILFTAYIPMQLVMKQADNIYEIRIHETKLQDDLKTKEELMVYAYSETSDEYITVFVQNRGVNVVEVVRIWLNDDKETASKNIPSGGSASFGPYELVGEEGEKLNVKVTTANGNVFPNSLGSAVYSSMYGWYTPSLGICVTIINDAGQYHIEVRRVSNGELLGEYQSSGTDHDDIVQTFLVPDDEPTHEFNVVINKRVGGSWIPMNVVSPVLVPSATGNPIVYVIADGT
jgi:hypothetical protein